MLSSSRLSMDKLNSRINLGQALTLPLETSWSQVDLVFQGVVQDAERVRTASW